MNLTNKENIKQQLGWEVERWKDLYYKLDRTTDGVISETSLTSGNSYSSTTGEEGILQSLENALGISKLTAEEWNGLLNEINTKASKDDFRIFKNEVNASLADIANVIVASGTGTAITLSMGSVTAYTANMKLTFIASSDNSGSHTTININGLGAKNLYKPNTTTAPNLKGGKPYIVWYDGTNFFLQASAEGNALAEHVLAGKTFSNGDNTGIVGTMPNKGIFNLGLGVSVPEGYYSGGTTAFGKKHATGVASTIAVYSGGQYDYTIKVRGLAFKPTAVFGAENTDTGFNPEGAFWDGPSNHQKISYHRYNGNPYYLGGRVKPVANGFDLVVWQSPNNNDQVPQIKWVAYE